jgi:hypothetical protein
MLNRSIAMRILSIFAILLSYWAMKPIPNLWYFKPKHDYSFWILMAMIIFIVFSESICRFLLKFDQKTTPVHPPRTTNLIWSIFSIILLYLFLRQYPAKKFYGDAGAIVGFLQYGVVLHKREPLSPALFYWAHEWIGKPLHWSTLKTIQEVTSMGGAIAITGLWHISQGLIKRSAYLSSRLISILILISLLTLGCNELWFGYVENYTIPTMLGIWASVFALGFIYDVEHDAHTQKIHLPYGMVIEVKLLVSLLLLSLGIGFHLSLLTLLPGFFILVYLGLKDHKSRLLHLFFFVLPLLILWLIMQKLGYLRAEESGFGGGDGRAFVPCDISQKTKYTPYLCFSKDHLLAIFNQQKLIAPTSILLILWLLPKQIYENIKEKKWDISALFLFFNASCTFGLTVIWNPDLGPLIDWDLFASCGFYLSFFALYLLLKRFQHRKRFLVQILVLTVLINLSQSLGFILLNRGL